MLIKNKIQSILSLKIMIMMKRKNKIKEFELKKRLMRP
jgi:hypothetical protein